MFTDQYGLPVQADGDGNDQLQRVGMILATQVMLGLPRNPQLMAGIASSLQPEPGIFTRYTGSNPNTVSADQLIPVLIYLKLIGKADSIIAKLYQRFGFAQNTHDLDLNNTKAKLPDLMILRALPILFRNSLSDLYLVLMAISAVIYSRGSMDNVDRNNTRYLRSAYCERNQPTMLQ